MKKNVKILSKSKSCFNDVSVNANPISVRLKPKRQRINTVTFYLRDISALLIGVVFNTFLGHSTNPRNMFK